MEIYVHSAGRKDPELLEVPQTALVRELVAATGSSEFVWLQDADDPIDLDLTLEAAGVPNRGHVHRSACTRIDVRVRFNGAEKTRDFAPAATVETVLKWATGEHGFELSAAEAAKHTLAQPGADHPLDPRVHIGSLVGTGACDLVLDLIPKVRFEG
jgi:hypothetical protein